jgi:peripheral-type benzodiazepine receptor-associated protein 1
LVTWLPVTLDQFGTSNGCPVTGYAVFAAHKKLGEIDSPTGKLILLITKKVTKMCLMAFNLKNFC